MPPCKQCGAKTVHDADVGLVCPECGDIADPAGVVLASDVVDLPPIVLDNIFSVGQKAIKTARNRYLTGTDKETRTRKSLVEMHQFIKNLSRAALVSTVSDRAYHLFQQAMATGEYRWGRTAKLVAGACVSIALRLNSRPELFVDISQLLEERTAALTSTFSSVISVLKMDHLPSSEPKSHIYTLQEYLYSALNSHKPGLPSTLVSTIKPLAINSILATAMALSELLVSAVPPSAVARLPASPTACAVLMWAIEAELRTSLAQVGELAAFLASKCNATKPLVMGRYKTIQDELIERIDKVDWLDHYEPNSGKSGRAKISRRTVAARGIKTVIEPVPEKVTMIRMVWRALTNVPVNADEHMRYGMLHDFYATPLLVLFHRVLLPLTSTHSPPLPLPTYLLTSSVCMRRDKVPSRLQLLAASRGGVGPDEIHEEELFEEDELDKIFRTEEEAEGDLRIFYGWEPREERLAALVARATDPPPKQHKRARFDRKPEKSSRINAESVALFMTDDKSEDGLEFADLLPLDDDTKLIVEENGDVTGAFMGLSRSMILGEDRGGTLSPEPEERYVEERYVEEI
ncbi:hypothetical protein C8F01DRAFT_1277545 [Mycena amicta]|nr:hypothetical protein C8F01DRAFT_1277545 [Mycena amicta]